VFAMARPVWPRHFFARWPEDAHSRVTVRPFVTKIGPKGSPPGHLLASRFAYSRNMRGAFVVQLGPESNPSEGRFEGWVEEVDSCTELRFRSTEELLKFMAWRFDLVRSSSSKSSACEVPRDPPAKKPSPKTKKSK
jgi:hypothetical protein